MDSITVIHKQTLDSSGDFYETVTKSQEMERKELYGIINANKDKEERAWAKTRLDKLDSIANERIDKQNEFVQNERDTANRNTIGIVVLIAAVGGFLGINNKQIQKNLIPIKNSIISK